MMILLVVIYRYSYMMILLVVTMMILVVILMLPQVLTVRLLQYTRARIHLGGRLLKCVRVQETHNLRGSFLLFLGFGLSFFSFFR